MKNRLIGFAGQARAGKTTSARICKCLGINSEYDVKDIVEIVKKWNYYSPMIAFHNRTIVSFADPLRRIAEVLTGIPAENWKNPEIKKSKLKPPYDKYTGREFLEYLGTEVLRDNLTEQVHIHACHIRNNSKHRIFDDVRLTNEAEYIKSEGGVVIKVVGRGEARNHRSGIPLPDKLVDMEVDNSKNISYLAEQLKEMYNA